MNENDAPLTEDVTPHSQQDAENLPEPWDRPRLIPLDLGEAETGDFYGALDLDLGPKV